MSERSTDSMSNAELFNYPYNASEEFIEASKPRLPTDELEKAVGQLLARLVAVIGGVGLVVWLLVGNLRDGWTGILAVIGGIAFVAIALSMRERARRHRYLAALVFWPTLIAAIIVAVILAN